MNKIYAPWRHKYVTKTEQATHQSNDGSCVFCDAIASQDDDKHYILKRYVKTAVIMNLYPYNGGHIMVIPYSHVGNLEDLDRETRYELMDVTTRAACVVKQVTKCEGLNIGLNLGPAGGGGIQGHLHMHILPRWKGDTNFMATLADTSLICTDFNLVFNDLKQAFAECS